MSRNTTGLKHFLVFAACAAAVLLLLFWKSFDPNFVQFSNDGPLGSQNTDAIQLPSAYNGYWFDLNSIGENRGSFFPGITSFLLWVLGPLGTSKFYAMLAVGILGLCACAAFQLMQLRPAASLLGGLATMLSTGYFGNSCWGVGTQCITVGMACLAIGLLANPRPSRPWIRMLLAGLCLGMAVIEFADIGMWFSFCAAAFLMYLAITGELTPPGRSERKVVLVILNVSLVAAMLALLKFGIVKTSVLSFVAIAVLFLLANWAALTRWSLPNHAASGMARTAVVGCCALILACQTLETIVGTQIKNVSGMRQDPETKAHRWAEATLWSFPKRETLGLVVPEIFGCRMDTPSKNMAMGASWFEGGTYWGAIGRHPAWERYFSQEIRPNEVLRISCREAPQLNTNVVVRSDGNITLGWLGDVKAAGLTRFQLQQSLTERAGQSMPRAVVENPGGSLSFTAGSVYLGVLVVLVALWAVAQSLRARNEVFSLRQRKIIWFWAAVVLITLLLSYGRFAPFYELLYSLPYASITRNPAKFLAVLIFAVLMLFAYGLDGITRRFFEQAAPATGGLMERFKRWWASAGPFDRRWTVGCILVLCASFVGWRVYAGARESLERYLSELNRLVGYSSDAADQLGHAQALFSIGQVGWFVLLLAAGVVLLTLILSGCFAGRRSKVAVILLGLLLVVDLGRANLPYLVFWDYKYKYDLDPADTTKSTNPILNFLRDRPYERRVAGLPFQMPPELYNLYKIEWAQHQFLYFNIQSLDVVQMPRTPENLLAFEGAMQPTGPENFYLIARRWQLTNTRYLIGLAGFAAELDRELDANRHRFRIVQPFNIGYKPGFDRGVLLPQDYTAVPDSSPSAPCALIEFTGALPRAKLYSNWHVSSNRPAVRAWTDSVRLRSQEVAGALDHTDAGDLATLYELTEKSFAPERTVLLAPTLPAGVPASGGGTNDDAGTVEFASYAPKNILLKARATTPCILLLNDKYDAEWQVWVDGKREEMLRCNFIMRGVYLTPGDHSVEFRFRPRVMARSVTLAAIAFGLVLLSYLGVSNFRAAKDSESQETQSERDRKRPEPAGKLPKNP